MFSGNVLLGSVCSRLLKEEGRQVGRASARVRERGQEFFFLHFLFLIVNQHITFSSTGAAPVLTEGCGLVLGGG